MAVSEQIIGRILEVQVDGTELPISAVTFVPSVGAEETISKETYLQDDGGPTPVLKATATSSPASPVAIGDTVMLTATPVGGIGPYRYTWTAGSGAPAVIGIGAMVSIVIPAGATSGTSYQYTVSVLDAAGNTASAAVRVGVGVVPPQPDPLTATITASPTPAAPGTTVALRVTPGGGTPSYTYAWSGSTGAPAVVGSTSAVTVTIPTLTTAKTWTYTCVVRDSAATAQSVTATVNVTGQPTVTTGGWPGLQVKTIVGLNVDQPSQWDSRMAEVGGAGKIKARRVYGGATISPTTGIASGKLDLVKQARDAGMLPIFSYKTGNLNDDDMKRGTEKVGDQLEAIGVPCTASYHHEPRGDMTTAEFVRRQKMLMPLLERSNLSRGPILNGFLSESNWTELEAWCPDELFSSTYWQWWGADCYQQGSLTNPAQPWARRRMERCRAFLDSRGYTDWKILVGETNGFSAASMTDCMEGGYDPANGIWVTCMWDSGGLVLTGDRVTAFANSLDDPRRY